jgi:hypothetical protein
MTGRRARPGGDRQGSHRQVGYPPAPARRPGSPARSRLPRASLRRPDPPAPSRLPRPARRPSPLLPVTWDPAAGDIAIFFTGASSQTQARRN